MRLSSSLCVGPVRRGQLYLVPDRNLPRLQYVPAGRTLHLIDAENLAGGSCATGTRVSSSAAEYRATAGVGPLDHIIIASGPTLAYAAASAWPGSKVIIARGVGGADRALLSAIADVQWIAARFDRVVLGSGDGIFADAARALRSTGVAVGVVAQKESISWKLRASANFVRALDPELNLEGAA